MNPTNPGEHAERHSQATKRIPSAEVHWRVGIEVFGRDLHARDVTLRA
jgi:hypothetical protein